MTIHAARGRRRAIAALALAPITVACGGADDGTAGPDATVHTSEARGNELAGVRFDVRRDPG